MKVTYNSLREYADIRIGEEEVSRLLTDCGLEIDAVEKFESVRGGLKGLVVGKVLSCVEHPNSDHLHITKVDIGEGEPLNIVCGAANVAEGQKVIVATLGTVLYSGEESFTIKKSKIRGEESFGMICAEDEIGVGKSHDGIMVLDESVEVGTKAADLFDISSDTVFEIGLTPNRADATSQIGVARDLVALLKFRNKENIDLKYPSVDAFKEGEQVCEIAVEVQDSEACKRYSGIVLEGIKVEDSPKWLTNRLLSLGIRPINNVVDVTNFVLMELGQPLHAFDIEEIKSKKIEVRLAKDGEVLKTLDGVERKLFANNLMICNAQEPMCIAGVFGGEKSGVKPSTNTIFLESAYFEPSSIRKTAKQHGLNTDASFRYERGCDPNITIYALKRACLLLQEICGAKVKSSIVDIYPQKIENAKVECSVSRMQRLIGREIPKEEMISILSFLEMKVEDKASHAALDEDKILVEVPTNKPDVCREADIVEEILRIYGYNAVGVSEEIKYSPNAQIPRNVEKIKREVCNFLSDIGFSEILNNSLCRETYAVDSSFPNNYVSLENPLSSELNILRPSLVFGNLQSVGYNINRKQSSQFFYEFGRVYIYQNKEEKDPEKRFKERDCFSICISGLDTRESWNTKPKEVDFYTIKEVVEKLLRKLRIEDKKIKKAEIEDKNIFSCGLKYEIGDRKLLEVGEINSKLLKMFDIKQRVFYAEIDWNNLLGVKSDKDVVYAPINKFPEVRRDLALLVDKSVKFERIKKIAMQAEKGILKDVGLFDVYEGDKLPDGKKSYAVNFSLQDKEKTLTDSQIEKSMSRIFEALKKELGAELR